MKPPSACALALGHTSRGAVRSQESPWQEGKGRKPRAQAALSGASRGLRSPAAHQPRWASRPALLAAAAPGCRPTGPRAQPRAPKCRDKERSRKKITPASKQDPLQVWRERTPVARGGASGRGAGQATGSLLWKHEARLEAAGTQRIAGRSQSGPRSKERPWAQTLLLRLPPVSSPQASPRPPPVPGPRTHTESWMEASPHRREETPGGGGAPDGGCSQKGRPRQPGQGTCRGLGHGNGEPLTRHSGDPRLWPALPRPPVLESSYRRWPNGLEPR